MGGGEGEQAANVRELCFGLGFGLRFHTLSTVESLEGAVLENHTINKQRGGGGGGGQAANVRELCFGLGFGLRFHTLSTVESLEGAVLENVDRIKYLGVTLTNDLKCNTNIGNTCIKAHRTLGTFHHTPERLRK